MQQSNAPTKLVLPFANAGGKNTIPTASQIGITAGAASLVDGFPPLTRTPLAGGGVPPSGLDMNGVLYSVTALARWLNAGGAYPYDSTYANDSNVGGYPKGSRVLRSDGTGYWLNTSDNNVSDPEAGGAGWVPDLQSGSTSVTMTGSNVTLTSAQAGRAIIIISGALTANLNLVFPTYIVNWDVVNNTTGNFTITCKTAAGTGVLVKQGTTSQIYGDGTNIKSAGLNTLIDFSSSFGTTGYQKLPSGLIKQWGITLAAAAAASTAASFPISFPTAIVGMSLTASNASTTTSGAWLDSISLSGFNFHGNGAFNVYWEFTGY